MLLSVVCEVLAHLLPLGALLAVPALGVLDVVGQQTPVGEAGPGVATPEFGAGALVAVLAAVALWAVAGVLGSRRSWRAAAPGDGGAALVAVTVALVPGLVLGAALVSGPYAHPGFWTLLVVASPWPSAALTMVRRSGAGPAVAVALTLALLAGADRLLAAAAPEPPRGLPSVNAPEGGFWHFAPGAEVERDAVRYRFHGTAGFRGPAASVMVVGDSIPFGGGYPLGVTFPARAGAGNAGIPSFSVDQIVR